MSCGGLFCIFVFIFYTKFKIGLCVPFVCRFFLLRLYMWKPSTVFISEPLFSMCRMPIVLVLRLALAADNSRCPSRDVPQTIAAGA
jgi:hypothetical protein